MMTVYPIAYEIYRNQNSIWNYLNYTSSKRLFRDSPAARCIDNGVVLRATPCLTDQHALAAAVSGRRL